MSMGTSGARACRFFPDNSKRAGAQSGKSGKFGELNGTGTEILDSGLESGLFALIIPEIPEDPDKKAGMNPEFKNFSRTPQQHYCVYDEMYNRIQQVRTLRSKWLFRGARCRRARRAATKLKKAASSSSLLICVMIAP